MFERTGEFISCVWIFRGNREAAAVLTTEGFLCANRSQVRLTESFLITVQPPLSTLGSAQRDGLHTCLWDPQNITPTLSGDIRLSVMYGRQPETRVSSRSSRRPQAASHRARRGAAEHTHTASFSQFSFWCLWSAGKTDEIFRWSCCLFIPAQRYSDIADRFCIPSLRRRPSLPLLRFGKFLPLAFCSLSRANLKSLIHTSGVKSRWQICQLRGRQRRSCRATCLFFRKGGGGCC